jgi:hypothetical protein
MKRLALVFKHALLAASLLLAGCRTARSAPQLHAPAAAARATTAAAASRPATALRPPLAAAGVRRECAAAPRTPANPATVPR